MTLLAILLVGAATGFLGGLFGKGGSALATPVLAAFGVPPIIAVASPLPATIPGTLLAARQYGRKGLIDRKVTKLCIAVGLPATVVGALLTRWIPGESLVSATDLIVGGLGISILVGAARRARRAADPAPGVDASETDAQGPDGRARLPVDAETALDEIASFETAHGAVAVEERTEGSTDEPRTWVTVAVAAGVGLSAGLLANSGGFLLAPLFLVLLRLPVRRAMGTSLAVAAALAVPGTITHAALGHIDLTFVLVFGAASVPLSVLGARTGLRVDPERLEVVFGAALVLLSTVLLAWG